MATNATLDELTNTNIWQTTTTYSWQWYELVLYHCHVYHTNLPQICSFSASVISNAFSKSRWHLDKHSGVHSRFSDLRTPADIVKTCTNMKSHKSLPSSVQPTLAVLMSVFYNVVFQNTAERQCQTRRPCTNLARASTLSRSSITGRVAGFLSIGVPPSVFSATKHTKPPATTA